MYVNGCYTPAERGTLQNLGFQIRDRRKRADQNPNRLLYAAAWISMVCAIYMANEVGGGGLIVLLLRTRACIHAVFCNLTQPYKWHQNKTTELLTSTQK